MQTKNSFSTVVKEAEPGKNIIFRTLWTACSFRAMNGVPMKQAQKWMSHSDIKLTDDVYSQIVPSLQGQYLDSISKLLNNENDDGAIHVIFSPMELMEKLAALVPPPRIHIIKLLN